MSSDPRPVQRRQVFYIPGYDPIHPRRYRELYRKEGAAQAEVSGYDIALSPGQGGARYGWHVEATIDGHDTAADFQVLVWSDIVKDSMEQGIFATYLQLIRTAWTYIASGALFRLMRLRKGPVIAALYPVGFLLVQLAIALLVSYGVWWGIVEGWNALFKGPEDWFAPGLFIVLYAAIPIGLFAGYMLLRWFKAKDNKLFAYYLMHDYAYSAASKGANPPELEARMAEFTDEIAAALQGGADEVCQSQSKMGPCRGVKMGHFG